MQKSKKISDFLMNLDKESFTEDKKSLVLASEMRLQGGVTNTGNCQECYNYITTSCAVNKKTCINYDGVCAQSTNGGTCTNYPKRTTNLMVPCENS